MKNLTKRNVLVSCLSLFGLTLTLAGCSSSSSSATITNTISSSIYGYISDIKVNGEDYDSTATYSAGDTVTFVVYPAEDFLIGGATVNGNAASTVLGATNTYQSTLSAGTNRISATFSIDPTVDIVSKFKLNIDEDTFDAVMNTATYDFREDGIEEMDLSSYRYLVDGDTTHFTTKMEGYTVKVRYLGIDTPESSSVIEKWGKAASEFNASILDATTGTAKHVILQSQGRASYPDLVEGVDDTSVWESETDGYNRNLAYVWYATVDNPELEDFRCLNLEIMYEGYSQGLGSSLDEMGEEYYIAFNKANLSAEANQKNYYSSASDPNYYWDNNDEPVNLDLKTLYESTTDGTSAFNTDSPYADNYTFYRIYGYVSRKTETSYFIQDQPSYDQSNGLPEAYGIYVFTYATNTIAVGDYVAVIGVISSYSGNYQMQGTSYNVLKPDTNKNTIVQSSGHTIEPIQLTAAQFESQKYRNVLVTITDTLDCREYQPGSYLYNRGGIYEIDTSGESSTNNYTLKYPFYFDDHSITTFGTVGSETTTYYRIKTADEIYLTHDGQNSYSYKFFSGGDNLYASAGAKYAYNNSNNEYYLAETDDDGNKISYIETTYKQRSFTSLTAISQAYVSTSGQTTSMLALIVARGDITLDYTN